MTSRILEYRITDFVILLILFLSMTLAYGPRYRRSVTALAVLGMTVLGSLLIILQEQISFGIFWLYLLVFLLVGSVYAAVFLKGQFWLKFAMVSVYCCTYFLIMRTVCFAVMLLTGSRLIPGMRYIMQPAVFASGYFLYRHAIHAKQKVPAIYSLSIVLTSVLSLLMISSSFLLGLKQSENIQASETLQMMIASLSLLYIVYTTFWLAHSLIRRYEYSRLQVSLSTQAQGETQMALEAQRLNREVHKVRHEVGNLLMTLAALLDQGQSDKARQMLDEYCASLPSATSEIHSGNPVSDAILNQKLAQARAQGIAVTAQVCMDSSQAIRDTDLSALLSNLLNNALEASAQVDAPTLDIRIYPAKNYLCISVRNRADMDALRKNPLLQTTKTQPEAHGLGLEIVREIVERYHGMLTLDTDEDTGCFVAQVMLMLGE